MSKNLEYVYDFDICESDVQIIAQQNNCTGRNAKGLAQALIEKFPEADFYSDRESPSKPGTIELKKVGKGKWVCAMYAQRNPGNSNESKNDSSDQRLEWFKECLKRVGKIKNIKSVAFPYNIGCGLAGGDWGKYHPLLITFAKENPGLRVVIVSNETEPEGSDDGVVEEDSSDDEGMKADEGEDHTNEEIEIKVCMRGLDFNENIISYFVDISGDGDFFHCKWENRNGEPGHSAEEIAFRILCDEEGLQLFSDTEDALLKEYSGCSVSAFGNVDPDFERWVRRFIDYDDTKQSDFHRIDNGKLVALETKRLERARAHLDKWIKNKGVSYNFIDWLCGRIASDPSLVPSKFNTKMKEEYESGDQDDTYIDWLCEKIQSDPSIVPPNFNGRMKEEYEKETENDSESSSEESSEVPTYENTTLEEYTLNNIPEGWETYFNQLVEDGSLKKLSDYIAARVADGEEIYPPLPMIYNAFSVKPEDIEVVILGQDPYHDEGQAMGISFSVPEGVTPPPSLKNIYKELKDDGFEISNPKSGDLSKWVSQGVFMINTALTVKSHTAGSHSEKWIKNFTESLICYLSHLHPMVFVLWGKHAQTVCSSLSSKHKKICSPHPSPFSAHTGFFGSKPFSTANSKLKALKKKPIDWSL
jgi:uracil-DNA glycosylase